MLRSHSRAQSLSIFAAWNSAAIFGALPYTPPNAVALYCQATSGGPWTPCVPGLGITSPINLFAGSTINGTAICLVNGTNCPASSSIPNAALTMTAATSDTATVTGATAGMHCTFSAADPISAAQITTLYISAVGTGTVTITHTAGASGGTVNILCP